VAGNLSITAIHQAAAKVEHAIRRGDASIFDVVAELESTVTPQIAAIQRGLEVARQTEWPAMAGRFDADATASAIARLKALIESSDGEAPDAVDQLAESLAGSADPRQIAELRAAINEFDFERAATALEAVVAACAALRRPSNALSVSS
jgi:hypothetical protein